MAISHSTAEVAARSAARDNGESRYLGDPCNLGHEGFRFTVNRKCVECNRIRCSVRYAEQQAAIPGKVESIAAMRAAAKANAAAKKIASKIARTVASARQAALSSSAMTYVGRPCPKGHDGVRYAKHGTCVTCAAMLAASVEKKAYDKARYETVKDHVRARSAAYYAANSERAKRTSRAWIERNPDQRRTISQNYKHKRRAQEASGMRYGELMAWKKATPKVCYWCGCKCAKGFVVDHYEPLSKGGAHVASNLVIACRPCNARKSAKDPLEFAQSVGRLF
jgi:5-methylcytosine-specific restriction endonuclease McrA